MASLYNTICIVFIWADFITFTLINLINMLWGDI